LAAIVVKILKIDAVAWREAIDGNLCHAGPEVWKYVTVNASVKREGVEVNSVSKPAGSSSGMLFRLANSEMSYAWGTLW
jgi:hypothetical protein